jgi:Fe-S cluster assembly protein SufD
MTATTERSRQGSDPRRDRLPTKRDEAWRYAPHRRLAELSFGSGTRSHVDPIALDRLPDLDGPRTVVVGGVVDRTRSRPAREQLAHQARDLFTRTLADDLADGSELARSHLDRDAADAFMAATLDATVDGVVIDVAAGVRLGEPIHVVDVATPDGDRVSSTGVVIRLGEGSSATVVESRIAVDGAAGSGVLTTIIVERDATLEHVVVQDLPADAVHLGAVDIVQEAGSVVRTRSFNLGAAYGRLAYHVELAGEGASVDMSGLYFGTGEQILDQQLTVVHAAPNCTSRQSFRGVLDDASTGVFNGGIDVCPGADGTDAAQSNDNLLLSNRAEVNTQPRLEILADEVACKHGATVGQLDDAALYYLRSRGIGVDEAQRLLINGFADQVIDDVSIEALRHWITARLGHDHE